MKKGILVLLPMILTFLANSQVFNFTGGKLDLSMKCKLEKSFQYTVKSKLGAYVSAYNNTVNIDANKMKDYIMYEDSSLISAMVKFHPVQSMQQTLWDGEVTFEKQADSVLIKIEKLTLLKYSGFAGEGAFQDGELTESKNKKIQKSMLIKLKEIIDYSFFDKFIQ